MVALIEFLVKILCTILFIIVGFIHTVVALLMYDEKYFGPNNLDKLWNSSED